MASVPRPPSGHFNVLYFASAGSYTTKQSESIPAPLPLKKLFSTLEEKYGGMKEKILSSCLVTINLDYVDVPEEDSDDGTVIKDGDEVAIIPPVSSG
jgi:molybdopterin converting factor small subunit